MLRDLQRVLRDPKVRQLAEEIICGGATKPSTLKGVLDCFRDFTWVGTQGVEDLEQVRATKTGNCLSLSLLLWVALAAAEVDRPCVLLAGGGLLNEPLVVLGDPFRKLTVHCWVVTRGQEPCLVDPVNFDLKLLTAETLTEAVRLAAPVDGVWAIVVDPESVSVFRSLVSCYEHLVQSK